MPLQTLLNDSDRSQAIERLRRVRPDSEPEWGTLDAPRLLCHVADQLRVALGDLPSKPVHNWATRTLLKLLVVDTAFKPPRAKIETAPEMLSSVPTTWEGDLASCVDLAERVGKGSASAVHPMFGPMSPQEWGRLCWKHLDHHLRQFGV